MEDVVRNLIYKDIHFIYLVRRSSALIRKENRLIKMRARDANIFFFCPIGACHQVRFGITRRSQRAGEVKYAGVQKF